MNLPLLRNDQLPVQCATGLMSELTGRGDCVQHSIQLLNFTNHRDTRALLSDAVRGVEIDSPLLRWGEGDRTPFEVSSHEDCRLCIL